MPRFSVTLDDAQNGWVVLEEVEALKRRVAELEATLQESYPDPGDGEAQPAVPDSGGDRPRDLAGGGAPATEEASVAGDRCGTSLLSKAGEPEVAAVEGLVARETNGTASPTEVLACWELLKNRGAASPRAFKLR